MVQNTDKHIKIRSCLIYVRFQVLTAASMMFRAVFWVILPCLIYLCTKLNARNLSMPVNPKEWR
jgi:hypothetical protein